MATTKKLIAFEEDQIKLIEAFAEKNRLTFTGAVQDLVNMALVSISKKSETPPAEKPEETPPDLLFQPEIDGLVDDVENLKKEIGWWSTDDAKSRLGNAELAIEKLEKKVNVLVATAKMFKGHLNNREIHLQD